MKYQLLGTLLFLTLSIPNLAFASSGDSAHGGGVIKRDWGYISFATAGVKPEAVKEENVKIKIEPNALTALQIPGLDTLVQALDRLPINSNARVEMEAKLLPSPTRKYFKVDKLALSDRQRQLLLEKYKEITKIDVDGLAIAAITDPETNETYLLPEFYELQKDSEKAAILFHEVLWLYPNGVSGGYNYVMASEIDMQNYIDTPTDQNLISIVSDIGTLYHSVFWSIAVALQIDIKSGVINDLLEQTDTGPGVRYSSFFQNIDEGKTNTFSVEFFRGQVYYLMRSHPKSLFLAELSKYNFRSWTHGYSDPRYFALNVKSFTEVETQESDAHATYTSDGKRYCTKHGCEAGYEWLRKEGN